MTKVSNSKHVERILQEVHERRASSVATNREINATTGFAKSEWPRVEVDCRLGTRHLLVVVSKALRISDNIVEVDVRSARYR